MEKRKAIIGIEEKEKAEHPETILANEVSIMDFARKNNFVINYEDNKIAKIQDILTDGEITVFKENNTWSVNEDGKKSGGRTIRFVSRMLEMEGTAAIDFLVVNRTKYKTSDEYNKQHEQINQPKETESQPDETVKEGAKSPEQNTNESAKDAPVVDVKPRYSKEQLAEIIMGTKRGLDIKVYDNVELTHLQMHELRLGLENGVNLSKFALKNVPHEYIKEVRLAAQDNLDLKPFALRKKECIYSAAQAKEIRLGMRAQLSKEQMKVYMNPELNPDVMRELRLGLQDGFEMKGFDNGVYTAKDIHTVRMHMMVKRILENIKQKFTLLFEQIHDAIQQHIQKEHPQLTHTEVGAETDFLVKDVVKEIYENIEDRISEKNLETKKEILAGVFQKVVAIGNAIEEIYPEQDKVTTLEQAVDKVNEAIQEKSMSEKALDALKTDYIEKFNQNELNYNAEVADLSQQVMNENNLTSEQKKELLQETVGKQLGEDLLEKIMEYIPEPPKQEPKLVEMQEVIEYMQDFEFEQ